MDRQRESRAVSPELLAKTQPGLEKLWQAYRYAEDVGRDVWDFAVEIRSLRAAGLSRSDLRWLVCSGLVAHRVELRRPDEDERNFRDAGKLKFFKRSCFVLTPAGANVAAQSQEADYIEKDQQTLLSHNAPKVDRNAEHLIPEWDPIRRELKVDGEVVKQFKLPSPNQETVLTVFQEEGWPLRIDDPLPQTPNVEPRERLHNTIRALNRHQRHRRLRIKGDGTGEGVLWEIIQEGEKHGE